MFSFDVFTLYPPRLSAIGGAVLLAFASLFGALMSVVAEQPKLPSLSRKALKIETDAPQPIPLFPLQTDCDAAELRMPDLGEQVSISLSPCRPGGKSERLAARIRLKGGDSREVFLPAKIPLAFSDRGILCFADQAGPFWIDVISDSEAYAVILSGDQELAERVLLRNEPPPLQKGGEFAEQTPERSLGEAKWGGSDLVAELGAAEGKQKIEFGEKIVNVGERDWLCWQGNTWILIADPSEGEGRRIAKIRSAAAERLEWDVWDERGAYIRLLTPLQPPSPIRCKTEEWCTSLRIRSERQVSCKLDKQPLILRAGDWALLEGRKWRIIRKAEEKSRLVAGEISGDLFVLDEIDSRQKYARGRLFLANRTQCCPVEIAASQLRRKERPGRQM